MEVGAAQTRPAPIHLATGRKASLPAILGLPPAIAVALVDRGGQSRGEEGQCGQP